MSVREYKSSVFTMLEETPEYALSTYNALNGSNYKDPKMVTIQKVDLRAAINRAIDECIREGILADFFKDRRAEVLEMAVLDFTFERREKLIARDSREEGIELGRSQVAEKMLKANKPFEEIMEFTGILEDELKEVTRNEKRKKE